MIKKPQKFSHFKESVNEFQCLQGVIRKIMGTLEDRIKRGQIKGGRGKIPKIHIKILKISGPLEIFL